MSLSRVALSREEIVDGLPVEHVQASDDAAALTRWVTAGNELSRGRQVVPLNDATAVGRWEETS